MRRPRKRPVYYSVSSMHDGTVLAAHPVRKPTVRPSKGERLRVDEDNVSREWPGSYVGSFDMNDPGRLRFFDIMANRLNVRRSLRELVTGRLDAMEGEIASLRATLAHVEELLTSMAHRQPLDKR